MTNAFTLERQLQISILPLDNGLYNLKAFDHHRQRLDSTELASYLFFHDEHTFFGLLTEVTTDGLQVGAEQLLYAFPASHPYVSFKGVTKEDDKRIESILEAADAWKNRELWSHAKASEDGIEFNKETLNLSTEAAGIIQSSILQKLANTSIGPTQLQALLPHLQKFGWPGETVTTLPIQVAFRLTEPDE